MVTLYIENSGNFSIRVYLNGQDKGEFWGQVGASTDSYKLAQAWIDNNALQYKVKSHSLRRGSKEYYLVAFLVR